MVQMSIELFVSVRAVRELHSKEIDRYMINNVRIRARRWKLELQSADIEIYPKHFNTSFIMTYKETSNNYTEGKFLIVILFDIFS